jgi:hypothetical protein
MTRSYVANFRKGRIVNPGHEKMRAIAKAIGFPAGDRFEEVPGGGQRAVPAEGRDLAERVGHLFETVRRPKTGEPYTSAEVARMSAGLLTEQEVEGMKNDVVPDPTVTQVMALAAAFGVPPLTSWTGTRTPRSSTGSSSRACATRPRARHNPRSAALA